MVAQRRLIGDVFFETMKLYGYVAYHDQTPSKESWTSFIQNIDHCRDEG